ncbi:hypothetical protein NL53_00170 [Vibrio variabilis]|uniref:DUF3466 family protein n=1 Tax=Vibrio variabilis TaxID=990271 RepID=A0ABR4YGU9_9VIBR|nr:DUF3466 family protein [Vibrio variabilis]KHA62510.1 hypothetical protein NL53_00170 [Vibrio variabilis]
MSSKIFKISMVAATVAASFSASAAIYQVHAYQPANGGETFGAAIQSSTENCWLDTDCNEASGPVPFHSANLKIAIEEKQNPEGFNYRNEAPFLLENGYDYLEDGYDGFRKYCDNFLDYSKELCKRWASRQYSAGYATEGSLNNSYAYIEDTAIESARDNVIINQIVDPANNNAIGTYYGDSLKERTQPFGDVVIAGSGVQAKVFSKLPADGKGREDLYVGSVSFSTGNSNDFRSQAAIWTYVDSTLKEFLVASGGSISSRSIPQGSARDVAEVKDDSNNPVGVYAVGYDSNSDEIPLAAVFKINGTTVNKTYVGTYNDDNKYLNSLLTSVNDKGVAIGTVKYREPIDGAYANRLFYVPDVTKSSLGGADFPGDIFFTSANGIAGAINNNSEAVGQVDFERHQESNGGKPRAKRAFIAPLSSTDAKAPLGNKAWYLDDLTYGLSSNNAYRVIDATDINDAGVIAGTAYYCKDGFDSSAIDASCKAGASIVAVKLVPINGKTSSDIQSRPRETTKVERQGAGFGLFALTVLGLIGFRRK